MKGQENIEKKKIDIKNGGIIMPENQEKKKPFETEHYQEKLNAHFKEGSFTAEFLKFLRVGDNPHKVISVIQQDMCRCYENIEVLGKSNQNISQAINNLNARLTAIERFLEVGKTNQKKTISGIILPN